MLDEIKSTVNASQAQLKSLSDDLKSSSQNLEASQEKVIQPVVTLLQTCMAKELPDPCCLSLTY